MSPGEVYGIGQYDGGGRKAAPPFNEGLPQMIKPEMLWNFLKTCEDTAKVGRVCRMLGRQKVPDATEDENLMAHMIDNASSWMDEKLEHKRKLDRERKRKSRANVTRIPQDKTESAGQERVSEPSPPHPPITHSLSYKQNNSIINNARVARARVEADVTRIPVESTESADSSGIHGFQRTQDAAQPEEAVAAKPPDDHPTLDLVLKVAADGVHRASGEAIPEDFVREWYALMETSQWCDTRGQKIIANGWRAKLAYAWRDEKRRREREAEDKRKKETIGVRLEDDNYQIRL